MQNLIRWQCTVSIFVAFVQRSLLFTDKCVFSENDSHHTGSSIREAYNSTAATVLGVIHILCGIIAFGADVATLVNKQSIGIIGICTSVPFFVSGIIAICGARSGSKCLVVTTMVMAIISAVSASVMLMSAFILHVIHANDSYRGEMKPVFYGVFYAMGATMLFIAIASACLTCYPLCCRNDNPNQVPVIAFVIVTLSHCEKIGTPHPGSADEATSKWGSQLPSDIAARHDHGLPHGLTQGDYLGLNKEVLR